MELVTAQVLLAWTWGCTMGVELVYPNHCCTVGMESMATEMGISWRLSLGLWLH